MTLLNTNIKIFCIVYYILQNTKMDLFEYIISVYNSFVILLTQVQLDTNDVLCDYGGM